MGVGDWGRVEQSELPKREWFQPRRTLAFFQLARETTVWSTWEQKANSEKGNNLTFELEPVLGSDQRHRAGLRLCDVKAARWNTLWMWSKNAFLFDVGTRSLHRAPCTDELGDFRSWIHVFMMHIYIYIWCFCYETFRWRTDQRTNNAILRCYMSWP